MHMPSLPTHPGSLGPLSLGHRAAGEVQQGAFSLSPGSSLSIRTLLSLCLASPVRLACGGPKDRKRSSPKVSMQVPAEGQQVGTE